MLDENSIAFHLVLSIHNASFHLHHNGRKGRNYFYMKYIFTSIINNYISDYRELFFEVAYRKFHRSICYPIGTLFLINSRI